MKNRILTFIIGVLTGAIITSLGFIILNKPINNDKNFNEFPPNVEMRESNPNMGEPPEMRNDKNQNR